MEGKVGNKETKRKMVEKLETLVRNSCLECTGKEPIGIMVVETLMDVSSCLVG